MAFYSGFDCDNCLVGYQSEGNSAVEVMSITHLRKAAREAGFSVGKQVLCPECKANKKPVPSANDTSK